MELESRPAAQRPLHAAALAVRRLAGVPPATGALYEEAGWGSRY